jgi:hypothetical protein
MEIKDWVTFGSLLLIALGWVVNGILNRRLEIAKKRIDFRLNTLNLVLEIWAFIEDNPAPFLNSDFLPLLVRTRKSIQLYGKKDEILEFEKLVKAFESRDLQGANKSLHILINFVRKRIRCELKIR